MSDWLKINHSLLRSPKLKKLALLLGVDDDTALGCAVRWLMFIDEQTTDGNTELEPAGVDSVLGREGASAALISIGWAVTDMSHCMCATDFEKHCGDTAKKRSQNARRQSLSRLRSKSKHRNARALPASNAKALPEKNNNIPNGILYSASCATADAAQHGTIVHEPLTEEELAAMEAEVEAEWQAMRQALRNPSA